MLPKRISWSDFLLTNKVLLYSLFVRSTLLLFPLQKAFDILHVRESVSDTSFKNLDFKSDIQRAILRVSRRVFWRFACLEQALVCRKLLNEKSIPSKLYIGVKKGGEQLEAHAWLMSDDQYVCGESGVEDFTVLQIFE